MCERTEAGNLTDEGIRQYLLARFNRVTKIKDQRIAKLEKALDYATSFINGYGEARIKENLGREGMDAVLKEINKIVNPTDICPVCSDEKPVSDLHRNCGE